MHGQGVAELPQSQAAGRTRGLDILIVVSFANLAGAQIAALRLARGLRERGHNPKVLFLYEQVPVDSPDHPYEVLLPTAAPGAAGYLRIAWSLVRRLRRERPDAVLSFLPLANVLGQAAALAGGVRRRVISHRMPANTASPLLRRLDSLWARLGIYTRVVAVSGAVRDTCRHYPARLRARTVVVYNGIRDWQPSRLSREDARRRLGVPDGKMALVAVGRFVAQKNYPFMLRLAQRLPGAVLLIAGDGVLRPQIEQAIAQLGIGDRVRLLGNVRRPDIPDLLAAADVFIQTSTYEGQSNSVLEALQAGVPVVVHDVPEQRETIADDDGAVAGALVPLEDLDAWVAAIGRLRGCGQAACTARATARQRAALFKYDTMIDGFEQVLTRE
jgi:glycosyltransferase involved in cell wall biosynthesis